MEYSVIASSLQRGSVLFMVLVFMVLISMIGLLAIDTSMLTRKMVMNIQAREDTFQMTEGILNEVTQLTVSLLEGSMPLAVGDVLCGFEGVNSGSKEECTTDKKVLILSGAVNNLAKGAIVEYSARFYKEETVARYYENTPTKSRPVEHEVSESLLLRYMEIRASYNGIENGLSKASLARGIVYKSLLPDSTYAKDVSAGDGGSGTGRYLTRY